MDAAAVLSQLGCLTKEDGSFSPVSAHGTKRYHVNAQGREFELLVKGPKFFDTRLERGGGGAVDLVMHLHDFDFSRAVAALRRLGL